MKLIVGLGNPGRKYQGTRHNIGFEVVLELAARYQAGSFRRKFNGKVNEVRVGETPALLLLPTTYMNLSGSSVLAARDFYRIPTEEVLVVCDDFNLSLAQLRFRARGSAGGQKGLADILRRLGTQEVSRLRFGVGAPPPRWDTDVEFSCRPPGRPSESLWVCWCSPLHLSPGRHQDRWSHA